MEQKTTDKIHKSFTLVWEVDSYSSIIEYNLWFRPFQVYKIFKKTDWTKLTIPAEHSSGPMHSKAYSITGLKENTVYEAMLFSRNRYGWSKPSKIFRFSIDGTGKYYYVCIYPSHPYRPTDLSKIWGINN